MTLFRWMEYSYKFENNVDMFALLPMKRIKKFFFQIF